MDAIAESIRLQAQKMQASQATAAQDAAAERTIKRKVLELLRGDGLYKGQPILGQFNDQTIVYNPQWGLAVCYDGD